MFNVQARRLWGLAAAILVGVVAMVGVPAPAQAAFPVSRTYRVDGMVGSTTYGRGFFQGTVNVAGNVMSPLIDG